MNLNLKLIAIAAAMVASSGANALTNAALGNSSFALVAFNPDTNAYYVRDLGFRLNTWLPSSVTTSVLDGGGSAVTGTRSPEAGFNYTWGDTNGTFASWVSGQSSVLWTVAAGDNQATSGTTNVSRALVAFSKAPVVAITNNTVRSSVGSANGVSGLTTQNPGLVYDATGATVLPSFLSNNSYGNDKLTALGNSASLYYYAASVAIGGSGNPANFTIFGNSQNTATLTLASSGVLTYDLQPASPVPAPAAAWLMISGQGVIGGMVRRRQAAAAL